MMNQKHEKMGEEKTFEVIQEGVPKGFHHPSTEPHLVRRGLTEVSAMFDRNGKGYLDDTERALRRMDSQDRGYLGIDKVCVIFESLQSEQERSSQLLEALRAENKKSLSMKRAIIALTVFTILLALANVGTSFAVSRLVKDTQVSHGDLQVKGSGLRVGTTSKVMMFEMESIDSGRRRRLQANAGLICESMAEAILLPDGNVSHIEKECSLQGLIKLGVAADIHDQLNTVDRVLLTCNNKKSELYGGVHLPAGLPGNMPMGTMNFTVFPDATNTNEKYTADQTVYVPYRPAVAGVPANPALGIPAVQAVPARPPYNCVAQYELAMYCPSDMINGEYLECLVMSAYLPTEACPTPPIVCGPYQTPNPIIF